jgi:branched-chain amino acid transport system substrate-binding protein
LRAIRLGMLVLCTYFALDGGRVAAQQTYDSGASDTEIKIGNTAPYTGPFSEYSVEEKAQAAYFAMINERGGINGRKITFVSVDDGSDPHRTLELTHRLVEQDKVLLMFSTFGGEPNAAIRDYLNTSHIPQLFLQANSERFDDPSRYPWTMGFLPSPHAEGAAYARYILQVKPAARIAILASSGEAGREYVAGVHDGLGSAASTLIVKEASFGYDDPVTALAAQVQSLSDSGADVFLNLAVGRTASEVIRDAAADRWHPLQFIPNGSLSIAAFLDPAGLEAAKGIMSNARSKGWLEGQADRDTAVAAFVDWMHKYNPQADLRDQINVTGYERAQVLVDVLRRCGNDLTRANVMRQAASLNLELGILRPGIKITTSPTDYRPIKQFYLIRFNGKDWMSAGAII